MPDTTRPSRLIVSRFLSLAAAAILSVIAARSPAAEPASNLLIIHTDEHNFRTLGCYRDLLPKDQALMWGDAVVDTPNIDALARRGALCTAFYATTPVCSPSRSSFVSGRYPQNTPVITNDIPMDGAIVTFAEVLRRRGYTTGYAGKWHLDGPGKPQWAPERKFGFEDNRHMFNRGHWKQLEDTAEGPRVKARRGGKPTYDVQGADEKSFTTDFLADKTVDFINANKDKPFCFMVSIPDPHGPDTVRPPYDAMFRGQKYQQPRTFDAAGAEVPNWGSPSGNFQDMAHYYGMVKCIDDNVGKIVAALRKADLLDRTIVVFTSDHGDLRGEHHRQNKGVPYEASARIPFIIRYPGKIPPGTVVREALGCVDFAPTILRLMGSQPAPEMEGRDASALLTTGHAPDGWQDVVFFRGTGRPAADLNWLAAATSRYKLVLGPQDDPWLFDLQKDPDERVNRLADPEYRQTLRELARAIRAYGQKHNDPRVSNPKIRADLDWAIEGEGPYVRTAVSPPAAKPAEKKAGAAKEKKKARKRAKPT